MLFEFEELLEKVSSFATLVYRIEQKNAFEFSLLTSAHSLRQPMYSQFSPNGTFLTELSKVLSLLDLEYYHNHKLSSS